MKISNPVNDVQRRFNELVDKGGGQKGGPARTKVQELLYEGGLKLNEIGREQAQTHLSEFSDRNPWHVCFALGLAWGSLAKAEIDFTDAATRYLANGDEDELQTASKFHYERGPDPIKQSLRGARMMFESVRLPDELPDTLRQFSRAQERWFARLLSKTEERPKYIGSWNATAMFLVGLFSRPDLASELKESEVLLPPNGPPYTALNLLHKAQTLSRSPVGTGLDDEAFEPGAIYENNALMAELLKGQSDWNQLNVHNGLYILGTRLPQSATWA